MATSKAPLVGYLNLKGGNRVQFIRNRRRVIRLRLWRPHCVAFFFYVILLRLGGHATALSSSSTADTKETTAGQPLQVRLGYPADAKLLILNADDLALAHAEDLASFDALDKKLITSATVMVPAPWFTEVVAYAKAHPNADLGIHLTLTSEWDTYRWGPVASRSAVPTLLASDGNFYPDAASVVKHAKAGEVEIELRAQIEHAISLGLHPSHLDAHMHVLYATPEFFAVFVKVANDYHLPIRMARNDQLFAQRLNQLEPRFPIPDAIFSLGADVAPSRWVDYYVNLVKTLQPGVTETFVHLAIDDAETEAIMVNHADWGAAWRQREFQAMSDPLFRKALQDNHVILIGWRELGKLLPGDAAMSRTTH